MPRLILDVPGMSCQHCEAAVTRELAAVAGVRNVAVDLVTKIVEVDGDRVDIATVTAAIDDAGFEVAGWREVR